MATAGAGRGRRAAVALATGAVLPAGRVFGLVLVGVVACLAATISYLAERPFYDPLRSNGVVASLPPVTAVVLATVLTGSLWLALRPPRWLGVNLGDAIWWTLGTLALWALPFGVLGAAAGSARPRRRRLAG